MKYQHGCPVQASMNVTSGKWKVQRLLSFGPYRFAELRKKLPRIFEKVLADRLQQLEGDGVLNARSHGGKPAAGDLLTLNAEVRIP